MSPSPAGSRSSKSSSVFCGIYVAKVVDAVENKGLGNTTPVDLQTLLEAFLNVSLRSACFSDEVFFFFLGGGGGGKRNFFFLSSVRGFYGFLNFFVCY